MSREILFRGKRVDNGEWVEGYIVKLGKESFSDPERYGICNKAIPIGGSAVCYNLKIDEVIPETVGQFTGLTDKNGKKVFEGDIVEFTDKYTRKKGRAEMVFEDFKWKYSGCYYGGNPIVWLCIDDKSVEFEIIGNIHDNHELLEVEE